MTQEPTPAEAMEAAARIAERWLCRNCSTWFRPSDGICCGRPDWERQGTAEEIAAAIRAEAANPKPYSMTVAQLRAEIARLEKRLDELRHNLLWRAGP